MVDRKFQNIIAQLTKSEKEIVKKTKIDSFEKLIPLLLKRVPPENSHGLISAIIEALQPSICLEENKDFEHFFEQLEANPRLIFDEKTQEMIKEFITKRIAKDKKKLIAKTSDLSSFINSMQSYLNDAIDTSGKSSTSIHTIKEKVMKIKENKEHNFEALKEELIVVSSTLEEEMINITDKLIDGKDKINELESKIKSLEDEIRKARTENKIDHLTGLLTRKSYDEEVKVFEANFKRIEQNYAIVFFDIDHFKNINDTYGHDGGDVILSTFAKILNKYTRDIDVLCRWGGEEFISLVKYKNKDEIIRYVNRIKDVLNKNSIIYNRNKVKVTFSAGIAFRNENKNYNETLKKADELLYQAKNHGRNQIRF